jgi:hypothetical protein
MDTYLDVTNMRYDSELTREKAKSRSVLTRAIVFSGITWDGEQIVAAKWSAYKGSGWWELNNDQHWQVSDTDAAILKQRAKELRKPVEGGGYTY